VRRVKRIKPQRKKAPKAIGPRPVDRYEYKLDEYKGRKIACVGFAPSTRELAPWDEEDVEIWVLNEMGNKSFVTRFDRVFQIHPRFDFARPDNPNNPNYLQWLQENRQGEVYMIQAHADIPTSREYPLEAIVEDFGPNSRYFSSSPAYMVAKALQENVSWIGMFGFSMGSNTEWGYQKAGTEFWLGVATGMFRATGEPYLYIPQKSKLLKAPLYGYDQEPGLGRQMIEAYVAKTGKKERELMIKVSERDSRLKKAIKSIMSGQSKAQRNAFETALSEYIKMYGGQRTVSGQRFAYQKILKQLDAVAQRGGAIPQIDALIDDMHHSDEG